MISQVLVVILMINLGETQDFDYFDEIQQTETKTSIEPKPTTTKTTERPTTTETTTNIEPKPTITETTERPTTTTTLKVTSTKTEYSLILAAISRLETKLDNILPNIQQTTTTITTTTTTTTPAPVHRFEEDVFEDDFFNKNVSFESFEKKPDDIIIEVTEKNSYQLETIYVAYVIGVIGAILTASGVVLLIYQCCQKKTGTKDMEMTKMNAEMSGEQKDNSGEQKDSTDELEQ